MTLRALVHPQKLRWIGLLASLLVAGFFIISMKLTIQWTNNSQKHVLSIEGGALVHVTHNWRDDGFPPPQHYWVHSLPPPGLRITEHNGTLWRYLLIPGAGKAGVARTGVSLLLPWLIVTVPTAWLWFTCRRNSSGHCLNCNYNLTGNISGRCPECGQPVTSNEAANQ